MWIPLIPATLTGDGDGDGNGDGDGDGHEDQFGELASVGWKIGAKPVSASLVPPTINDLRFFMHFFGVFSWKYMIYFSSLFSSTFRVSSFLSPLVSNNQCKCNFKFYQF